MGIRYSIPYSTYARFVLKKGRKNWSAPFALHGVSIFRKRCTTFCLCCTVLAFSGSGAKQSVRFILFRSSFCVKFLLSHYTAQAIVRVLLQASRSPIDSTGTRSVAHSVFKFLLNITLRMPSHGVDGLSAGKLVADRQYRYLCSQSLPNCDLCLAEKTERRTVIKRNGECYKRNGEQ